MNGPAAAGVLILVKARQVRSVFRTVCHSAPPITATTCNLPSRPAQPTSPKAPAPEGSGTDVKPDCQVPAALRAPCSNSVARDRDDVQVGA